MVPAKVEKLIQHLMKIDVLHDRRLMKALRKVPLEQFIPQELQDPSFLYEDMPLPFYINGNDFRNISAPHMICIMLEALDLKAGDNLLILGAKSGYIASLASCLAQAGEIFIVEANEDIVNLTRANLEKTGFAKTISVYHGSPVDGLPDLAPWQRILVTGQCDEDTLQKLIDQLDEDGGLLFAPVGIPELQEFLQVLRQEDKFLGKMLGSVIFGPLQVEVTYAESSKIQVDFAKLVEEERQRVAGGKVAGAGGREAGVTARAPVPIEVNSESVDAALQDRTGKFQAGDQGEEGEVPLDQIVSTAVQEACRTGGVVRLIRVCELLDVPFDRVTAALRQCAEGTVRDAGPNPLQDKIFVVSHADTSFLEEVREDLEHLIGTAKHLKYETDPSARLELIQAIDAGIEQLGDRKDTYGVRLKKLKDIFLKVAAHAKVMRELEEYWPEGDDAEWVDRKVALVEEEAALCDEFTELAKEDLKAVIDLIAWATAEPSGE
jgi:protein-L-isoaspartate(D-aspartate) O-methyltransferase